MSLRAERDIHDTLDLLYRVVPTAATPYDRLCKVDRFDKSDGTPANANLEVSHGKAPISLDMLKCRNL